MDFKFKIGDRVKILDGSKINRYTGGWCANMHKYCGNIATVTERGTTADGRKYYSLNANDNVITALMFDERGLEMANPKFKIGDKVKIHSGRGVANIAYVSSMDAYCGDNAIISNVIISSDTRVFYKLKGKPFNWHESLLEAVKNENKIVITTDGTTTRAALYDNHKLIKEAFSTCSKEDAFNFETGAKIAFERLTAKPAVKAKPKKELKPLNTKIFVLDGDDTLKSSHIYEIENGKILMGIGIYPGRGTLYTMSDVINYLKPPHLRSGDEKFDSKGEIFSTYNSLKQITVMEVKEG